MDLRHIQTLLIAAQTGSYRETARQKGITQPAVSQQIHAMEGQLGLLLFRRKGRGVELTEQGQALIDDFRRLDSVSEALHRHAGMLRRQEVGKVVIGYSTSLMFEARLPETLRHFAEAHPAVELQIDSMRVADAIAALSAREIDLAIMRGPLPPLPEGLEATLFNRSALMLAVPANHPLARLETVAPGRMDGETFLTMRDPPGIGLRQLTESFLARHAITPAAVRMIPDMTTLAGMVSAGLGIALLPREIALAHNGFAALRIAGPTLHAEGFAIHHRPVGGAYIRHLLRRLTHKE